MNDTPDETDERISYPPDFVVAVMTLYPDWKELHDALASGSKFVGRYLDDSKHAGISNADILSACSLGELQRRAAQQAQGVDLYRTWVKLAYPDWNTSDVG